MNFKKFLSLVLTLLMVVSLVPTVFATEGSIDEKVGYTVLPTVDPSTIVDPVVVNNVTGVTINKDFTWITVGVIEELTAVVSPSNATNQNVVWTSSNPNVATVDSNGEVKAIRPGTVTVTVTTVDGGYTASCTFRVVSQKEAEVTRDTVLILDDSGSMSGTPVTELKKAAKNFAQKYIDNPGINRLSVILYASSVLSYNSLTNDITIVNDMIDNMCASGGTDITSAVKKANDILSSSTADIRNMIIMTDGLPNNGESVSSGRYTSSDYSYYSYANALYNTAVEYHSEYRVFTFGFFHNMSTSQRNFGIKLLDDIKNAKFYEVESAEEEKLAAVFDEILSDVIDMSVTLDKSNLELNIGETAQLTAIVHPTNADNKNVFWSVADPSIVSVDNNGKIRAISAGETTVTVTTEKEGRTATCKVKVIEDLNDIMLICDSESTRAGKTIELPITLVNNPGISGLAFKVRYDSSVLNLKAVDTSTSEVTWSYITHNFGNSTNNDAVSFVYTREYDYVSNNTLATLVFEVADDAPEGDYEIEIYFHEACDENLDDVYLRAINGLVTVLSSVRGDTNADGFINVKDIVLLAQYLAGWSVSPDLYACDCNADGEITVKDIVLLSQYLADWNVALG